MSAARLLQVAGQDLKHTLQRPLFWILVLVVALTTWGLSTGDMTIQSGDSTVGGTKAWITSEFAVAKVMSFLVLLLYAFFVTVAAGMAVISDDDLQVGQLLHATRLSPAEYVYGKALAVLVSFTGVLAVHLVCMMIVNHLLPNPAASEVRGPFGLLNYVRPTALFGLPIIFFLAGTSLAAGVWTRRPILIFVLPVAILLISVTFLWDWSPSWLGPRANRLLMVLDPAGVRWLSETWLKVDRGVEFYNKAPMSFDATFALNRLLLLVGGAAGFVLAERRFASTLRGERMPRRARAKRAAAAAERAGVDPAASAARPAAADRSLESLGMSSRGVGLFRGAWTVARAEFKELGHQPGLYLFGPLILLQTIGTTLTAVGAFDTPLLATPGTLAVRAMGPLTILVTLLLLFYTVESMERERRSSLDGIFRATPLRTASMLLGKSLANALVGVVLIAVTFLACVIALLIQGRVGLDLRPFLLVWGLLLVPTFLAWSAFVMAVLALTGNRYTTYGICLGALIFTGYRQMVGKMNWVGNWDFWRVAPWTDMGTFELDRTAIILNRVLALGLAVFFTALTVRLLARRERDASITGHRLRPSSLLKSGLRLLPYAAVPLVAGAVLWGLVDRGFQGKHAEKKAKDYWRRNLATWKEAPLPDLVDADLTMEIEPARRWLRMDGRYTLVNRLDRVISRVPFTGGFSWDKVAWTMNGAEYKPEDRLKLYVFTPERPLAPGDSLRIGFKYETVHPKGVTKNGGGTGEFILPSGVVLTPFSPGFVPIPGFLESIGVDKDNRYETKDYPDDYYKGITKAGLAGVNRPFHCRISITGPAEYAWNSVGTRISDTVTGGRRTTVWQTERPVNFFNVVGGRWAVRRGEGTAVFYHPSHAYNVEEMSEALEAARRWYSEWFLPYPWRELKLSEFPGLANYAQGFPTDITFSESIGFLTKSDPRANAAFMVTAHESAHQWWGNILMPGDGPGGDVLSEGTAHFSTALLFEQVKGPGPRIEFCKKIEAAYGDQRQVDSERPLVKLDGSKAGDNTVLYNKGGWVFWMLLNHMGRERAMAGFQAFIRDWSDGPDHALLQDFVAAMRPYAPDTTAYDAFTRQWFFEVVVPEYKLSDGKRLEVAAGGLNGAAPAAAGGSGSAADPANWEVTVTVTNKGTGTMPVDVAAVAGERFPKEKGGRAATGRKESAAADSVSRSAEGPDYREARTRITLGANESQAVTIRCPFKPERVLVDPDAMVLQLKRKAAEWRF